MLALASVTTMIFAASLASGPAVAAHVPVALDSPLLWAGLPGSGYLNFIEGPPNPFGPATEEYTGWVDTQFAAGATGAHVDQLAVPFGAAVDNGLTHGDRADYDFVAENRPIETMAIVPVVAPLHFAGGVPIVGPLTWEIAPTAPSAHIDPSTGFPHPFHGAGAELILPDYGVPSFAGVDVFSVIADPVDAGGVGTDVFALVSDGDPLPPREAALDYFLDFCSIADGCVPGVPTLVFVPGWDPAAVADDYVARWIPDPLVKPVGFAPTHVVIDPLAPPLHDEVTQIDAVVAFIPEPATCMLLLIGLGAVVAGRRL